VKTIERIRNADVAIQVPPSKAHTLRALILGSLATGITRVKNPLMGDDQLHLIECLRGLGVDIRAEGDSLVVTGTGGRFHPKAETLDCGESGVAMNFLSAVASLSTKHVVLTGKEGLLRRPVDEIIGGVRELGGTVEFLERDGFPPLRVSPTGLAGGTATMRGAKTSQYFSSLTIAAACAEHGATILCSDDMSEKPYFDITVDMMRRFGVAAKNDSYKTITVAGEQRYTACDVTVESDYSSASYFIEAAAITGARVFLKGLARDSVQGDRRILDYAKAMGASAKWREDGVSVAGGELKPIDESFGDTPDLVPTVAVMAAFAEGTSYLRDVARLKFKECDRVAAIIDGLARMDILAEVSLDDLVIHGNPRGIKGRSIASMNDHRIAMAFAVAGLAVDGQSIDDETCVKKSFPNFWETFATFGK
jgi:3-phosphoshikimate 1-carboxyvinyltransferase